MDQGSSNARLPRYLLAGRSSTQLEARLGGAPSLQVIESVDELLSGEDGRREPGWVFLPPDIQSEVLADLLVRISSVPGEWSPLLLVDGEDGLTAVPVAPGHRESVRQMLERVNGEGTAPGLASFRVCLNELSRIRHDMNNPLTAALAEVQLVLMDVEAGSEVESALRTVEDQLRRIRDMVAELTALRPPPR